MSGKGGGSWKIRTLALHASLAQGIRTIHLDDSWYDISMISSGTLELAHHSCPCQDALHLQMLKLTHSTSQPRLRGQSPPERGFSEICSNGLDQSFNKETLHGMLHRKFIMDILYEQTSLFSYSFIRSTGQSNCPFLVSRHSGVKPRRQHIDPSVLTQAIDTFLDSPNPQFHSQQRSPCTRYSSIYDDRRLERWNISGTTSSIWRIRSKGFLGSMRKVHATYPSDLRALKPNKQIIIAP